MRFIIGSGFTGRDEFSNLWLKNSEEWGNPVPSRIIIIGVDEKWFPNTRGNLEAVCLNGNLGHVGKLLNGKDREFCGWSAAMLSLAMMAYADESDFIYKEEDCLAFGPWIRRMYVDIGKADLVFGKKMESEPWMECAQSLFLVRHKFIPEFVSEYLRLGSDKHLDENGNADCLPERKFVKIEEKFGEKRVKRLSFGCDRERPIPYDDAVFYAQKLTDDELEELRKRKLI